MERKGIVLTRGGLAVINIAYLLRSNLYFWFGLLLKFAKKTLSLQLSMQQEEHSELIFVNWTRSGGYYITQPSLLFSTFIHRHRYHVSQAISKLDIFQDWMFQIQTHHTVFTQLQLVVTFRLLYILVHVCIIARFGLSH